MSPRVRRLVFGGLLVLFSIVAVVFAAVAGAATAPPPEPEPAVMSSAPVLDNSDEAPRPPRRFVAMGPVVAVREDRLAVKVPSRDQPIVVVARPMTVVRINMRRAELSEIQAGDHVVVVGRPNPRGNLMARAIAVVRRSAAAALE